MAEWEAEIKIRRNGRLVRLEKALGRDPKEALLLRSSPPTLALRLSGTPLQAG